MDEAHQVAGAYVQGVPTYTCVCGMRHPVGMRCALGRKDEPPGLTPAERIVVKRLSEGATVKGIASELRVSPKTVEMHSLSARRKIGHRSIAMLTRYALQTGISKLDAK